MNTPEVKTQNNADWRQALKAYERQDVRKAYWQLANTLVPYAALWVVMVYLFKRGVSYWLILPFILLASGFLIRIFIFFHDCTHGSFLPTYKANRLVGYITGILTFTAFEDWQRSHSIHHATAGNLDRRGTGDVWTMTVEEYLQAPRRQQIFYRIIRNPFAMFGLGPAIMFFLAQRVPKKGARKRERNSVILTDLALGGILLLAHFTIGLKTYLLIQIPVMWIAGVFGIWLFYVQHQFEDVYWARDEEYDPIKAALQGSSFYKLPKILQWISGNIGFHHIHHLSFRVPNYFLPQAYENIPKMQQVKPLTLRSSLKSLFMNLYDEGQKKMISFRDLKGYVPAGA